MAVPFRDRCRNSFLVKNMFLQNGILSVVWMELFDTPISQIFLHLSIGYFSLTVCEYASIRVGGILVKGYGLMKKALVSLLLVLFLVGAAALADAPVEGALYAGIDPWGNPISVILMSEEALTGVWTQNFGGELFTQAFENAGEGFAVEGLLGDTDYITCRYSGTMKLDGDALTVTFTDGEMTEESENGGSTAYHVEPLDEAQRTVTLVGAVQGDYSGVTVLDAAQVESFAAGVRLLYLNEDWEALAQLISYPITM